MIRNILKIHLKKILFILIFVFAVCMRFYNISFEAFWFDEAFTYQLSDNSISEVLYDNAKDVHPFLYYLGFKYFLLQMSPL